MGRFNGIPIPLMIGQDGRTDVEGLGPLIEVIDVHQELGWQIYDIMGKIMFGGEWSTSDTGHRIKKCHQYCIENSNRWAYLPDEMKENEPDSSNTSPRSRSSVRFAVTFWNSEASCTAAMFCTTLGDL